MNENVASQLKIASVFVFIGFLMTIGMTAGLLLNPEGGQFHDATDPQNIISDLSTAQPNDIQMRLAGIVFDTFFIVGYAAIFYGLFLLTRSKDPFFPKLALILGLMTGLCDMIENAIHIALYTGVPNGWTPEGLYFATLWSFTFIKDLTSYMAGMIFIVMLFINLSDPPNQRIYKIILILLVGFYVGLGSIAVVERSFLLLRNLSFMIDMLLGAVILNRISSQYQG